MKRIQKLIQLGWARERGSAIIVSLFFVIYLAVMTSSLFLIQFHRTRLKTEYVSKIETVYAAEGMVAFATEKLWSDFLQWNGGASGAIHTFRDFLDSTSGLKLPTEKWVALPLDGIEMGPGVTGSVSVYRVDGPIHTELRFQASATTRGHTETIESVFRTQGSPYQGFEFGLLSNNITCIFCHADFDSVEKYTGKPYERVRVASLDTLMLRTNPDSNIFGTLYVMNQLLLKDGTPLDDLSGIDIYGRTMTDGMIDPATTSPVELSPAPVGGDGNPEPGHNFYKDYPTEFADQTDGYVPSTFPSVFPTIFKDGNSNRVVDDDEYQLIAGMANGTAKGYGYVIPNGATFGGNSLSTANTVSLDKTVEGNLILTGTEANPIQLDGRVVVNGDIIIQGKVKGTGTLIARGNVYITGDLTYDDAVVGGTRQFGVAADGTENTLGISAGGNILVGDYLTSKKGDVTDVNDRMAGEMGTDDGFAISQYSIFNRREWQLSQARLPGPDADNYIDGNNGIGFGVGFVDNSTYIPDYVPRYYVLDKDNPVLAWMDGGKVYWDDASQSWIGKEHGNGPDDMNFIHVKDKDVVISTLNPTNPWVTPQQLKSFWIEDENQRAAGEPFTVDGLLYTSNAIFTLARKASQVEGQLEINGALVARDCGVLVGAHLQINYDQRVKKVLTVYDDSDISLVHAMTVRR